MVAYQLALPLSLLGVHEVFHVSMLGKHTSDPTLVVDWGELVVYANGTSRRDHCVSWIAGIRFCEEKL